MKGDGKWRGEREIFHLPLGCWKRCGTIPVDLCYCVLRPTS